MTLAFFLPFLFLCLEYCHYIWVFGLVLSKIKPSKAKLFENIEILKCILKSGSKSKFASGANFALEANLEAKSHLLAKKICFQMDHFFSIAFFGIKIKSYSKTKTPSEKPVSWSFQKHPQTSSKSKLEPFRLAEKRHHKTSGMEV